MCSSDDSEDDGDDEWRKTPMGKRIKNARQSLAVSFFVQPWLSMSRKRLTVQTSGFPNIKRIFLMQVGDKRKRVGGAIKEEEDFEEEGDEDGKPAKKRSSTKAGWIDPYLMKAFLKLEVNVCC